VTDNPNPMWIHQLPEHKDARAKWLAAGLHRLNICITTGSPDLRYPFLNLSVIVVSKTKVL
jgi:hypothetical protein